LKTPEKVPVRQLIFNDETAKPLDVIGRLVGTIPSAMVVASAEMNGYFSLQMLAAHASPEGCNPWKRAGGIFDAFRLGQNKGIQPLLCHQPLRPAPVKESGSQSAYFVVRL
jgi:hypothetical protein